MKKQTKSLIATLTLGLMLPFMMIPTSANSAQQRWNGSDATGAIITDGDSPIVVEHENLTFDLAEFPNPYYYEEEDFIAYSGRVTAEYHFYNPSDMTVTATLAFPFGEMPDYAYAFEEIEATNRDISVNGEAIEAKLRYTFTSGGFNLERDIARLSDEYLSDDRLSPETTVTIYKWNIGEVNTEYKQATNIATDIKAGDSSRIYYFEGQSGGHKQKDGDFRIADWANGKDSILLYVIGEPLTDLPTWKFYQDGRCKDGEEISGSVSYKGCESMTLLDMAMATYDSERGIPEVDWYNCLYSELTSDDGKYDEYNIALLDGYSSRYYRSLMRWYQYEISLEPGERIVNSVSAPMYSGIDMSYTPTVYEYTYLLSPASTWKSFGDIDITINTPYYLTESTIDGFEKTEDGYSLHLDCLPEGELIFSLSTEENPTKEDNSNVGLFILLVIIMMPFVALWEGIMNLFKSIANGIENLFTK